jgi:hypothetical protein
MAKQFYSFDEAQAKLKTDENGLRSLVRQGRLREFRDGPKLTYRIEEVDKLAEELGDSGSGSSAAGEIILEPADDSTAGGGEGRPALSDSDFSLSESFGSGSSVLSLEDTGTSLTDAGASEAGKTQQPGGSESGREDAKSPGGEKSSILGLAGLDDSGSGKGPGDDASLSDLGLADLGLEDTSEPAAAKSDAEPALSDTPTTKPPADEAGSSAGLKMEGSSGLGLTGSDVLSLDEVDEDTVGEIRKDDTVITNVGISVFDDDDLEIAADPMAKTIAQGPGEDPLGFDSSGAGTGLLDLTRESDDTSLGADVLSDIEAADDAAVTVDESEAPAPPPPPEEVEAMPAAAEAPAAPTAAPRAGLSVTALPQDPSAPMFAGLLIAAILSLTLVGAATAAMTMGVLPGYLAVLSDNFLWFVLGSLGAGGLFMGIGMLVGRPATPRADKPAKAKKEKKEKPKKEKTKARK